MINEAIPQSVDIEQALLGTFLVYTNSIKQALEHGLVEDNFYDNRHKFIFNAMKGLSRDNINTDVVSVMDRLKEAKALERAGGVMYLTDLTTLGSSKSSIEGFIDTLEDKKTLRSLLDLSNKINHNILKSTLSPEDLMAEAEKEILEITRSRRTTEFSHVEDIMPRLLEEIKVKSEKGTGITGLETGFSDLDRLTGGFQKGDLIILAARASVGKGHPNWLELPTPKGNKKVGDLVVGDYVFDRYGKPTKVTGVFPRGKLETYKVTLSDGRSTIVDGDHIWTHFSRSGSGNESLIDKTTEFMYNHGVTRKNSLHSIYSIPTNEPVQIEEKKHKIDPYVIGALIGDGCMLESRLQISSGDEFVVKKVAKLLNSEAYFTKHNNYTWCFKDKKGEFLRRKEILDNHESMIDYSHSKEIPEEYMYDSYENRMKLLNGLFDTDGCATSQGKKLSVSYSTTSEALKEQIMWLLNSCGFLTGKSLDRRDGRRDCYTINVLGEPKEMEKLFTLDRKREVIENTERIVSRKYDRVGIRSIEKTGIVEDITCISVEHKEQLYLANDFIVTHNTALALNLAKNMALLNKEPVAIFSLEMPENSLVQRIVSAHGDIPGNKLRDGLIYSNNDWNKLFKSANEVQQLPIVIDDSSSITTSEIFSKCRKLKNEHGLGVIIIDYLQLLSSRSRGRSREQEVAEIARSLKELARELDVPVIALSQLSRRVEMREDKRPILSDLRESGSIEQDSDIVAFLHREEYYSTEAEESDNQVMEVILRKHRNGALGTVELAFKKSANAFYTLSR